jgi:hypothetical protein
MQTRVLTLCAVAPILLAACQTTGSGSSGSSMSSERAAMAAAIAAEPAGDYYIGRRYYKTDYKFWGFIRSPRQPWSTAKLVMLNEQETLAPDRAQNKIGSDNNYEYKLIGSFTGQTVYEPASNGFYPEFALKKYQLLSLSPPNIYRQAGATDPSRRIIATPQ